MTKPVAPRCTCRAGVSQEFGHGVKCPESPSYVRPTHVVIDGVMYRLVPVDDSA